MALRKGDIIALTIDGMAYGGRGLGRSDGLVVFVQGGVPGDRITARIYKKKRDYAEAGMVELLFPSPDRVTAPCPYFGYCGGCQWQQVAYEKQLIYKRNHVTETLEHIGGLKQVTVHPALPSEKRFAYRNKMEFTFSDRRWYLPDELDRRKPEGDFALGLHVPGAFQKVIDIEACLLQQDMGNRIMDLVRQYARDSGIPVYGLKTHQGFWRYLTIRYSEAWNEWMVNIVTSEERQDLVQPLADLMTDRFERVATVVNNINSRGASIAVGERETVLFGDGYINDKIGPFNFRISANSFFQTNSRGAERLYETVVRYADLKGSESVLDLYSGTGTIPLFLAHRVRDVTGIEINRSATSDAEMNARENGITNCRFLCGDIREKLREISASPDLLIIDPPRAGMHKDVLAQVMTLSPEKIVYISCNPATLARDLAEMAVSYDVQEIQPVDMFPHTYHIEAVARLLLRRG
ncbi:MAG TPA: 23S rRNA (uracil(1939)-C(5))-methyltransferase RlmD [Desulfobacteraceae bacterium]|nr:23S rRNA (uracil(1939)-C(5))-methyltransferase RlmD [Desulfobacteraceae bacterium]